MDITHNIKSIRELKKVSQAEMARKLDLDPAAYFRIEKRGDKLDR
jgi:DNA-binding XRE family transcriptional regulator